LKLLSEAFAKARESIANRKAGVRTGISTPFTALNNILYELGAGDLCLVGGRPSQGKTALVLNIAVATALADKRVLFFSLEMSSEQLAYRVLLLGLSEELLAKVGQNIVVEDAHCFTIEAILQQTENAAKGLGDLALIVVDYVQLLSGRVQSENTTRDSDLGQASAKLKQLAKKHRLPVLALVQLNRQVEMRTNKRPIMSDIRESGSLEQDADQILMIYRPEYYKQNERPGEADIIIAKNRNGPTGEISLAFDAEKMLFRDF